MSFAAGTRLGPYEITAKLGEGGMGEVYRATDGKLKREVAIKVLPAAFTEDEARLGRFEREAQLLAQLQHPHIASIYGLEESNGVRALVMELVEGPTLADRLARGPLPLEEALAVARQIAEALEAAHGKGIVHRDLKPQNVKAPEDGPVKVLDFGLAKALDPVGAASGDPSAAHLAASPTLTLGATLQGVILGTAAYMSPEQAKGTGVDKRADIWAFGVIFYEMLTGHRLFEGDSAAETLAGVLKTEIDLGALPEQVPPALRRLLRRCLERQPRNRLHDIADARIVLQELDAGGSWHDEVARPTPSASRPLRRWAEWAVACGLGAAVTLALIEARRPATPSAPAPRATFRQLTFLAGAESAPALAADGESLAFVKDLGGQADIFLQRVDGSSAINLTEGCELDDGEPDFSPDGRKIAYRSECSGGGIFVMGALGESARKVTGSGYNPDWSPDGLELAIADEQLGLPFGRGGTSRISAVRVESGERRLVSAHDGVEPRWSPDGRRIAFWGLAGGGTTRDLYSVAADGSQSEAEDAVPATDDRAVDWSPAWTAGGRALLFSSTRGGTMNLWRVALDPATGHRAGEPVPITAPSSWAGYLSASADGRRLAFVDRNVRSEILLAPFDPVRGEIGEPIRSLPLGTFEVHDKVDLAADGGVLFASTGMPQHLFLVDPAGTLRQLTDGEHRDRQGEFSPDGEWIVLQSDRWSGNLGLIRRDGSGLRELPTGRAASSWYPTFSPDGKWIAAAANEGAFLLPLAGMEAAGPAQELPSPDGELVFWPMSWSADGLRIAGSLRSSSNVPVGAGLLDLAGGSYQRISDEPVGPARFLPDGRRLLLLIDQSRLVLVDTASGVERELRAVAEGSSIVWSSLSTDGRHIVWHEKIDESDIWLTNFEEAP